MQGCLEIKNFILNDLKQEIWYFTKHMENVTVCMACGSPRLATGLEGPECGPDDSVLAVCGSCWLVFTMLFPLSPFGSKAIRWKEKPVQAKSMRHPSPSLYSLGTYLALGQEVGCCEARREAGHPDLWPSKPRSRSQCAVAVLEPVLIFTHYIYNLPQISVIEMSML